MMFFRNIVIIAAQATLLNLVTVTPVSAAPTPQMWNWLHVLPVDIPSSLLPTTTEGVTIQRPTPSVSATPASATGADDSVGSNASITEESVIAVATSIEPTPTPAFQTSGALSSLALNNKLALGSSVVALAFMAL